MQSGTVRGAYPGVIIVNSMEKNAIDQADPSALSITTINHISSGGK